MYLHIVPLADSMIHDHESRSLSEYPAPCQKAPNPHRLVGYSTIQYMETCDRYPAKRLALAKVGQFFHCLRFVLQDFDGA